MRQFFKAVLITLQGSEFIHALPVRRLGTSANFTLDASNAVESSEEAKCRSLFVAVLTSPGNAELRDSIREMWKDAGSGWGDVLAKYAICTKGGVAPELQEEQDLNGDLLFMDECEEGYLDGVLTRKVAAAMRMYVKRYPGYELFMKIDDDTFMSSRRLCELLKWREDNGADNLNAYMGVFAEGPHEALHGPSSQHFPNRDPASPWYEPEYKFSGTVYPPSAKGGTGYILSRELVTPIIEEGIASRNELNNEDKAVGVWVDALASEGYKVELVNIHGTDGYSEHADSIVTSGTYKKYPHLLHHHLPGEAIACLHSIDIGGDAEARIDDCFPSQ